jgi:aminoglycoside 6'-N-acetyltransferase
MEDPAFSRLLTERLVIRRFEPADVEAFAAYRSDPDVARHQGWKAPYAREEAERFVESLRGVSPGAAGPWFQFAVALAPAGPLIGDCALRCGRRDPRQAELGFTIAKRHQGQGLAAEAVAAVLRYAFTTLALHRVVSYTDVRNAPARRLLERVGFRREGLLRESLWSHGEWASELLYAQLEVEWQRRSAP